LASISGVTFFSFAYTKDQISIALDAARTEVDQRLALVLLAGRPKLDEELDHGVLGNASHADGGADRIALDEGRDHLGPLGVAQLVHVP
jgi:hypothetical protein